MAAEPARALARAKVNLTLHLCGQRGDGYHLLDSLVVFPGVGDLIEAEPASGLSLSIDGPFADGLSAGEDNLILRAADAMASHHGIRTGAALHLQKNLPVASGIGGGSSNAATALRLLSDLWACDIPDALALSLGADVPVCLAAPAPMRMTGIGETLTAMPSLPPVWMVLVNPLIGVPTGAVFGGVEDRNPGAGPVWPDGGFATFEAFAAWLRPQRNDLQAPAITICPQIYEVLQALSDAPVARMSGSGATCFAIYPNQALAEDAAEELRKRTSWWVSAAPVAPAGTVTSCA